MKQVKKQRKNEYAYRKLFESLRVRQSTVVTDIDSREIELCPLYSIYPGRVSITKINENTYSIYRKY
jgi:hypothetical protein